MRKFNSFERLRKCGLLVVIAMFISGLANAQTIRYVNDASTLGDMLTTAAGSGGGTGSVS